MTLRREMEAIRKQLERQGRRGSDREQTPQEVRLTELLTYLAECTETADVPSEPPMHLMDCAALWEYRDVLPALLAGPISEQERGRAIEDDRTRAALCALSEWAAGMEEQSRR